MSSASQPAHDLLPAEMVEKIPRLYATEKQDDPIAWLKWFTPDSSWTWYVTEFDPEEARCFGLVIGFERELGYFLLDEIKSVRGKLGLPVERDLYFEPTSLSKCK